ncbi:hypothetical protein [Flavobacterium sp.]|uniref:hypothetical protein n=1 Tax=Flavobacterium sp. TaxID=239 RepID=UPI00286A230B|nr:hypothetical protein [Flavobacterium sp.]
MIVIQNIDSQKFLLNGIPYLKNFMPHYVSGKLRIVNVYDTKFELVPFKSASELSIDGIVYATISEAQEALLPVIYTRNSLGGVIAAVEDRIVNGVTTIAPSQNIVFDEFKKIEDRLDNKDYLESDTGFYLFGQDLTMFADWKWVINGIEYSNPANVVINIPLASSGYSRIDLIVCNALNGFTRVPGTESLFTPAAPLLPENTIEATFFTVTDGVVGVPVIPKPKGYVTSVNSRKGDVILTKQDVGLTYAENTSDLDKVISNDTQAALDLKVDKDGTKVLSDNNYTDSEKNKLASIDATHYLPPLQTTVQLSALPQATISDKARVYVENDLADYFYDATASSGDIAPNDQVGGIGFWRKVAVGGETAASIKTKYESNADTNAFTNALKAKLDSITEIFTTALKSSYDGVVTGYAALMATGSRLITSGEITKLGNTSGTNSGDQDLSGLSLKPIQVPAQVLAIAGWTLVGGYYEYNLANANITAVSIVDAIPNNSSIDVVKAAQIMPTTLSGAGTVKFYCENLPTSTITITLNIWK